MTDAPANPLKAALWMSGAILSFSSMAVAGRAVSGELATFETMMYRSFIGIVLVLAVGGLMGRWGEIDTRRLHIHAARNLCHFTGQNLWFFALTLIPLAQLFALEFTTPIWVALVAPLFLGEKMTRLRALSVGLGFVGVLVVVRPGAMPLNAGMIAAAASAIGFAGSFLFTKSLTRTASTICILFWLTVMQAAFGVVTSAIDGEITVPSAHAWPWLVLIGCAGLFAHLCIARALTHAPVTVVSPMDFVRLPAIAVVGALFYSEPLDPFVLVGAAVIFGANYLNIWAGGRR